MEEKQVKKYLVSVAVIGDYEAINKIIKNIYEDFSLVFYKTLIKTIIDKEDIRLEYLDKDDCFYNEGLKKHIGYFIVSSTINTKEPQKIINKLIDDEYMINSFIRKWSKNKVQIMLGVKNLYFSEDQYRDIKNIKLKC